MNKSKQIGCFKYNSYITSFLACIFPILDYCSEIWGFKLQTKCETIRNRAIRFFLGVYKFAPNLSITGDMGWTPSFIRRRVNMCRLWNR